jgi:hypothetical protein
MATGKTRRNQFMGGIKRDHRIPTMAVSEAEREAIETDCRRLRITMAQLVRCGLVLLGTLDTASLDDIPEELAERLSAGKPLSAPVKVPR